MSHPNEAIVSPADNSRGVRTRNAADIAAIQRLHVVIAKAAMRRVLHGAACCADCGRVHADGEVWPVYYTDFTTDGAPVRMVIQVLLCLACQPAFAADLARLQRLLVQ